MCLTDTSNSTPKGPEASTTPPIARDRLGLVRAAPAHELQHVREDREVDPPRERVRQRLRTCGEQLRLTQQGTPINHHDLQSRQARKQRVAYPAIKLFFDPHNKRYEPYKLLPTL